MPGLGCQSGPAFEERHGIWLRRPRPLMNTPGFVARLFRGAPFHDARINWVYVWCWLRNACLHADTLQGGAVQEMNACRGHTRLVHRNLAVHGDLVAEAMSPLVRTKEALVPPNPHHLPASTKRPGSPLNAYPPSAAQDPLVHHLLCSPPGSGPAFFPHLSTPEIAFDKQWNKSLGNLKKIH